MNEIFKVLFPEERDKFSFWLWGTASLLSSTQKVIHGEKHFRYNVSPFGKLR